jgi:MOSC domain-containing protein YiiM
MSDGVVVSVSSKETPGVGKVPRGEIVLVAGHGVEGDYHFGTKVRHRSRVAKNPDQPNLRQVHLIHEELFGELAAEGLAVSAAAMGENVTTRGIALLELPTGTRLHLGDTAIVELTGLRNPCNQLDAIDARLLPAVAQKQDDGSILRKGGVMGVVVTGGVVRPGDAIRVVTGVGGPLEPV